jgi:hypothetical protein
VVVYVDSLGITSSKFWGKLQEKTAVGTRRCTWENNFKMGLKEMGERVWIGIIWLGIVVGCCVRSNEPMFFTSYREFLD